MPRYYRRRYRGYRSGKSRYSNETACILFESTDTFERGTTFPKGEVESKLYVGYPVVAATGVFGTRKAKNFEISLTTNTLESPLVCALVYVPEGTLAGNFNLGESPINNVESLYEPNQNIICQFVIPANGESNSPQVTKVKTRLARNLDSGDSIVMIFGNIAATTQTFSVAGTVNYAIKY